MTRASALLCGRTRGSWLRGERDGLTGHRILHVPSGTLTGSRGVSGAQLLVGVRAGGSREHVLPGAPRPPAAKAGCDGGGGVGGARAQRLPGWWRQDGGLKALRTK